MHWQTLMLPLLNEPLEDRLVLSKRELATLKRAAELLAEIRGKLEDAYGEDDAYDVPAANPWVLAESHLYEALSDMAANMIAKLPPREPKP